MPLPVWLPVWLTNLLGGGWIRNALGIRKDLVDAKKAKLEVKKLQAEERTRERLITPATLEDVKRYDPKILEIEKNLSPPKPPKPRPRPSPFGREVLQLMGCVAVLLLLLVILSLWLFGRW